MTDTILQSPFPAATEAQWMAMVETGLKGADFDKTLVKRTDDGLTRGPLSTRKHAQQASCLPRGHVPDLEDRAWHISAPVRDPDISYANTQALRDLEGGASALRLTLDPGAQSGTNIRTVNDFKRLFEGIHKDLIPVSLAPSAGNVRYAALLATDETWRNVDLSLGISVLAEALTDDRSPDLSDALDAAKWVSTFAPKWKTFTINARTVHDRGASEGQELAFMAASAVAYVRAMIGIGLTAEQAFSQINVELAVNQDGHLGIAKIRAARKIWAKLAESFGLAANKREVPIHAITSIRMMTRKDPWTNMLRIMAAGFGAVCGGADYVMTRPFTDALGLSTPFGHRIARNMQLLMMEESHLGQVTDPAQGSFFHERMTDALARKAWTIFQSIESEGGIEKAITSGSFARNIKTGHNKRLGLVAKQTHAIVGVSLYPGGDLRKAKTRQIGKRPRGTSAPAMTAQHFSGWMNEAKSGYAIPAPEDAGHSVLPIARLSEPFENLRNNAPSSPVMLVTLSDTPIAHTRQAFTEEYLKVAGIQAHIHHAGPLTLKLEEAFEGMDTPLVFFAGTDQDYAEKGPRLAKALRNVRAPKIWICAKPDIASKYPYTSGKLYIGQDRLATLSEILGLMGVQIDV